MTSWLWGLLAAAGLRVLRLFENWQQRSQGKKEQKLEQAEEILKRGKKAKNTGARLTYDQRRKLRERYGRK